MNRIAFVFVAALGCGTALRAQMIAPANSPSLLDNPGVLGRNYADLGLTLERIHGESGDAYNASFLGNTPLAAGVDGRLGYNYWWYDHRHIDSYYHLIDAESRFYRKINRVKLFGGVSLGYEWSRSRYNGYGPTPTAPTTPAAPTTTPTPPATTPTTHTTTPAPGTTTSTNYGNTTATSTVVGPGLYYNVSQTRDNYPVWGLSTGAEIPVAGFALTPHVAYTDAMQSHSDWGYHYGLELHRWLNETYGAYGDVTYNDVRHVPNSWSYTLGLRARF